MPDLDLITLALLVGAGLVAGWVDAVVGGGGLIQLPALMLVPGIAPLQALATNKIASIMGTSVAAVTYARRLRPDPMTALPLAGAALAGAVAGALIAAVIPEEAFTPIILVVLIFVGGFTILKPKMGVHARRRWHGWRHAIAAGAIGAVVGVYDGALGPGTGSFFVILIVSVLGYAFMPASALGKIANFCTNLGALIFFIPAGHVLWPLGIAVGIANLVGGYLGARMALSRGNRFVRIVFIAVVAALAVKLTYDLLMTA